MTTQTAFIAHSQVRPWLVADDFDIAIAPRERPVAPPPPPPIPAGPTSADVAAAREEGRREAARDATLEQAARATSALESIAASLASEAGAASRVAEQSAESLARVVVRAVAAAFPALEARLGPAEVMALVGIVLPGLAREPLVSVRLSAASLDAVGALLARLPQTQRERIDLAADPDLGNADVQIAWRDGGAVLDGAAIRAAVLAALDTIGGLSRPGTGDGA